MAVFYAIAEAADGVKMVTTYVDPESGKYAMADAERRARRFRRAAAGALDEP